jgi:hypothetical protein
MEFDVHHSLFRNRDFKKSAWDSCTSRFYLSAQQRSNDVSLIAAFRSFQIRLLVEDRPTSINTCIQEGCPHG